VGSKATRDRTRRGIAIGTRHKSPFGGGPHSAMWSKLLATRVALIALLPTTRARQRGSGKLFGLPGPGFSAVWVCCVFGATLHVGRRPRHDAAPASTKPPGSGRKLTVTTMSARI